MRGARCACHAFSLAVPRTVLIINLAEGWEVLWNVVVAKEDDRRARGESVVPVPLHLEAHSRTGPVDLEVHLLSARGEGGDANGAAVAARVGARGHLAWR